MRACTYSETPNIEDTSTIGLQFEAAYQNSDDLEYGEQIIRLSKDERLIPFRT